MNYKFLFIFYTMLLSSTYIFSKQDYLGRFPIETTMDCNLPTLKLSSSTGSDNQNICAESRISTIIYTLGGDFSEISITGLPDGVTGLSNGTPSFIISGTPKLAGTFTYIITLNGSCSSATVSGTITVKPKPEITAPLTKTICNDDHTDITITANDPTTTIEWRATQKGVSGAIDGAGFKIDQVLNNSVVNKSGTVTYMVTPTLNNCKGNAINIMVTVNAIPVTTITDGSICVESTTNKVIKPYVLNTGLNATTYHFEWFFNSNKIANASNGSYSAKEAGEYSLLVTNTATTCISLLEKATVTAKSKATSISAITNGTFSENPTATITVTGTDTVLQYQLDGLDFQQSNIFEGLKEGKHTIIAKDEIGCTNLSTEFIIVDYPKYFSPNGDGIHETWNIFGLNNQPNTKIYIFDRYGKFLKEIRPSDIGWDGTFNGNALPSGDYWFSLDFSENNTNNNFKSHFTLKR